MQDETRELSGVSSASSEHEQHVQFSAPGVRGEVTLIPHPEGGRMLELGHLFVDSKRIAERIDPRFYAELEKQFGSDEATCGFIRSEAERWVERLLAYEALLSDAGAKGDAAFVTEVKAALQRTQKEIEIRFKGLPVLESESTKVPSSSVIPDPDLSGIRNPQIAGSRIAETASGMTETADIPQGAINQPMLVNPDTLQFSDADIWTPARQEAARNVIRYHQGIVTGLEQALEAFVAAHPDDPRLITLKEQVAAEREKALTTDSYSVADVLRRIAANDPGAIPTVELLPGAKDTAESAKQEAAQLFETWIAG
ncbi:MAG: hypothetical protein HY437_01010 [Candidatus Magasanikbacteria bacterium]|nr:hypothetical protein [Candidatus Magasanikbacteria bacterium]